MKNVIELCSQCILPVGYPNTKFDVIDGKIICEHCQAYNAIKPSREELLSQWEDCVLKMKKYRVEHNTPYDAVMAYSGGKDSTAALYVCIKKYGLRILAYTVNHGVMANKTRENIRNVLDALGVDWYLIQDDHKADIKKHIDNCEYPCGYGKICTLVMKKYFAQVPKMFRVPFVLTGCEILFDGKAVLERDEYTHVNVPAVLSFKREESLEIVKNLNWEQPGYFDPECYIPGMTDCIIPGIALELIYTKRGYGFDDVMSCKIETELLDYVAVRVRQGACNREDTLRKLQNGFSCSHEAWDEYNRAFEINT
jgi:predicted PP-loop superfamily ATPase